MRSGVARGYDRGIKDLLATKLHVPAPGVAFVPRLHTPGSDKWLALARGGDGTVRWASGHPQAHATAALALLAARNAPWLAAGVHHLHEVVDLDDVPADERLRIH